MRLPKFPSPSPRPQSLTDNLYVGPVRLPFQREAVVYPVASPAVTRPTPNYGLKISFSADPPLKAISFFTAFVIFA